MKKLSSLLSVLVLPSALFLANTTFASAGIILLTGGDPGEGYAPLENVYAAVNTGGSGGPITAQGVTFTLTDPTITITSTQTIGSQPSYLAGSYFDTTNDVNLYTIGGTMIFGEGASLVLTISGLNVDTTYQLDSLCGLQVNYVARPLSITAVGDTSVTDTTSGNLMGDGNLYDFRQTVKPDSSGKITVTYTDSYLGAPTLNGFSITSAPEPATPALLGMGLVLLGAVVFLRKRRA